MRFNGILSRIKSHRDGTGEGEPEEVLRLFAKRFLEFCGACPHLGWLASHLSTTPIGRNEGFVRLETTKAWPVSAEQSGMVMELCSAIGV